MLLLLLLLAMTPWTSFLALHNSDGPSLRCAGSAGGVKPGCAVVRRWLSRRAKATAECQDPPLAGGQPFIAVAPSRVRVGLSLVRDWAIAPIHAGAQGWWPEPS